MGHREKLEKEEARRLEEERMAFEKQKEEKRNEDALVRLRKYKEKLSEEKRAELRKRAVDEIKKMEGIKKEFVTEILIEAEENKILKSELSVSK